MPEQPLSLLDKYSKYKDDFYENDGKIYCTSCHCLINHRKKYSLDFHLKINK